MTHTILNCADGIFVGMWLITGDERGMAFNRMFQVDDVERAIRLVNFLNGGPPAELIDASDALDKTELL